jgi:hypothetical protein
MCRRAIQVTNSFRLSLRLLTMQQMAFTPS